LHRLVAPIALLTILLCASPASAAVLAPKQYGGQMKLGMSTASRSDSGSCSVYPGLLGDLVLRCDSSSGSATARYLFTLPKKAGSVSAQVNFLGLHRGTQVDTKRCSKTQFRVTVTQDSPGRADIESVMIEYYYPTTS
jgi:hypothetical protein